MRTIATIIIAIVLAGSLAGCNEDPKEKQASDAAKANENISKSTAAPSSTPSEKKYKY
jgi:uncharacterized lipoprotein